MSDKKWCAMCGKWGDHQSGTCPDLHPSERATSEPAGQPRSLDVATCSLPVSSAEALLRRWDDAAARYSNGGEISKAVGSVFEICAKDLRREMGLAESRQPEENDKAQPRPESGH